MTPTAASDLEELRSLHRYCANPAIYFQSVYKREPRRIAVQTYEMEVALRTSDTLDAQAYSY